MSSRAGRGDSQASGSITARPSSVPPSGSVPVFERNRGEVTRGFLADAREPGLISCARTSAASTCGTMLSAPTWSTNSA